MIIDIVLICMDFGTNNQATGTNNQAIQSNPLNQSINQFNLFNQRNQSIQ